jgi:hypothetical protein
MLLATLAASAELLEPMPAVDPQSTVAVSGRNDPTSLITIIGSKPSAAGSNGGDFAPGAIAMADLNGDGIPDLVVASSRTDKIYVYRGQGDGQFGPELSGGAGFDAGADPVSVSVADLNGDGRPDLIVANEGSNDVSILMNATVTSNLAGSATEAPQLTFEPAATINTGPRPVSAVVASAGGSGQSYLAVADSGSSDVMIFPASASGTVSGIASQVIQLDDSPSLLVPMPWFGKPGLVSLDGTANSISLITGLGEPNPQVRTIPSGGINPVAAQSFSDGDTTGLIVANRGDGAVAVFVESADGLTMRSSFVGPNLSATPSSSFVGARNLGVFVFAPNSAAGTSALVGFRVIGGTFTANTEALIDLSPHQQLQPLRQSDLALVSTLLPVSVQVSQVDSGSGNSAAATPASSVGSTTIPIQPGRGNGTGKDSTLSIGENAPTGNEPFPLTKLAAASAPRRFESPWENYVSGVDEAIEQLHKEMMERPARSPSATEASAAASRPAGDSLTGSVDPSWPGQALPARTSGSFKIGSPFVLPDTGLIAKQSGSAAYTRASAAEVGQSMSSYRALENPDVAGRDCSHENKLSRGRSVGLEAMLAAAVISPSALGKYLGSRANRRRSFRWAGGKQGRTL